MEPEDVGHSDVLCWSAKKDGTGEPRRMKKYDERAAS